MPKALWKFKADFPANFMGGDTETTDTGQVWNQQHVPKTMAIILYNVPNFRTAPVGHRHDHVVSVAHLCELRRFGELAELWYRTYIRKAGQIIGEQSGQSQAYIPF